MSDFNISIHNSTILTIIDASESKGKQEAGEVDIIHNPQDKF